MMVLVIFIEVVVRRMGAIFGQCIDEMVGRL